MRRLVAVVGPTAAGKSALALTLAQRFGGEIVNSDSRQIYRGMDIGTAKPSLDDRALVPHHLYDIADPAEGYSLGPLPGPGQRGPGRRSGPGTASPGSLVARGQYVWALLEAWQVPEVSPRPALRAELREVAAREGVDALHAQLRAVDPEAADRIDAKNVRRVVRAIEVERVTGRPISAWQTKGVPDFEFRALGVDREPDDLIWRINRRVEAMFDAGLVAETRSLLESGVAPDASALSSIGYSEAVREIQGEISREKAVELTKRATKRLSRRQRQWFRRQDPRITWAAELDTAEESLAEFVRSGTLAADGEPGG